MENINKKIIPVQIRDLKIGEGIPKICVPFSGDSPCGVIEQANAAAKSEADFIEWRADGFKESADNGKTGRLLKKLREISGALPLLVTYRSKKEGGAGEFNLEEYLNFLCLAAGSGCADMIDVELSAGETAIKKVLAFSHRFGVKVIVSNHDFSATPAKDEIVCRLCKMQGLGADISKIAVMPENAGDVLTLLEASEKMYAKYADRPFIAVSMSDIGKISRVCGEIFGSSVTFGTGSKQTAPGQMKVCELKKALSMLHRSF